MSYHGTELKLSSLYPSALIAGNHFGKYEYRSAVIYGDQWLLIKKHLVWPIHD